MMNRNKCWLVPIAGPTLEPLELGGEEKGLVLGRHEACELLLPASADKVSRYHARFIQREGRWEVTDLKSRWGTFLNGRKLMPEEPVALRPGDLLHIAPWTFSFSTSPVSRGLKLAADENQMATMVRTLRGSGSGLTGAMSGRPLSEELLALLLESATSIHNAADEKELGDVLLDTAARGSGLRNGALLRPLDTLGTFEVIAARNSENSAGGYSRTLIQAASGGEVAEFSAAASGDVSESIAQMNVVAAICVPLMLGHTVAAYLYLDTRGQPFLAPRLSAHATSFCAALGRIASLALAGLKRVEMERRAANVEAELNAGAEAQRFILPQRTGLVGKFSYTGESKPGRYVGGDFFDIIPLDEDRIAVALADVAGKGIPASVLMTAAQGYLHSALQQHTELSAAVAALNHFICPRCPSNKFLTLFVAVIDARRGTLTCVDAGHGYGLMRTPGSGFLPVATESNLPIGISADMDYPSTTIPFALGSELLIVSDGIIEQPAGSDTAESGRSQFDVAGVQATLASAGEDPIGAIFSAVVEFAGCARLADDATAVLVKYA